MLVKFISSEISSIMYLSDFPWLSEHSEQTVSKSLLPMTGHESFSSLRTQPETFVALVGGGFDT